MKAIPYKRVGTTYYKLVAAPTIAGHFNEFLVHWNIETIKQDHGKAYLTKIPKYDGFTCIPNHINFNLLLSFVFCFCVYRTLLTGV